MNLAVDCLRRPASFDQLKSIWQTLERLDPLCSPFLSWVYLSRWWQAIGSEDGKLRILIVRNGKEVVAIAPLFITQRKLLNIIPSNTLMFMGTIDAQQHIHHGVIAQPRLRAAACEAIINHMPTMKAWHSLFLSALDGHSTFSQLVQQRIVKNRKGAITSSSKSRYEVLPASWKGYKDLGGELRLTDLARIGGQLREVGKCELSLCSTREDFRKNQAECSKFSVLPPSEMSLRNSVDSSAFYSEYVFQGFLADLVWQVILSVDGEVAGVQHYSIERGDLNLLQGSYASSVKALGAEEYMLAYAIKRGIDQAMVSAQSVLSNPDAVSKLLSSTRQVNAVRYTPSTWRRLLESVDDRFLKR